MSTSANGVRREGRSPSYPGIDLAKALERAKEMYERDGRNAAHVDNILSHWGYSPKAGPGRTTFAALKKFGLMTEESSGAHRRGRLSDLALRILLDERPSSPDKRKAIQQAALTPSIHRELWDEYGGSLPSDETLRTLLRIDRKFTETGAADFINEFRSTIAFANLEGANIPQHHEDEGSADTAAQGGEATRMSSATILIDETHTPTRMDIQLPLASGKWATLQAQFPITEKDWDQMLRVLEAMRPGLLLVEPSEDSDASQPGSEPE